MISDAVVDISLCIEYWSLMTWNKAWSPNWRNVLEPFLVRISRGNIRNFFLEDIQIHKPERMGS